MFHYHDVLCKDIGMPHRRKSDGEQIAYSARDYEEYFKKIEIPKSKASNKNPNHAPQI